MLKRSSFAALPIAALLACHAALAQTATPLESQLKSIIAQHHGKVGLYATNLKTGDVVAINADTPVPTASVIKLTVLMEAMEQVRAGKAHLDEKLTLKKDDQVPGSGVLTFFDTPLEVTLKDALTMMVIVSDNTATNLCIDRLGLDNINARIRAMGLKDTYLYKKVFRPATGPMPADQKQFGLGKTTAREMAGVMERIVDCKLSGPAQPGDAKLCGVALHMLRNQFYRDGVPRYIESEDSSETGSAIANKTGAVDESRNDVAAVASKNGMLVISIFTYDNQDHGWSADDEGDVTIAKLGKAIVNAWSPQGLDAAGFEKAGGK
jgi:beta-lactamase class A